MPVSGSRVVSGAGTGAAAGTAILPGWGTAIGAVVGGIAGALSGDGGAQAAQDAMQAGMAKLAALGIPPDLSGPIIYQQLQAGGQLTPQMEAVAQQELFNPAQVKDNAQTRTQLTSALQGIQGKAFGGLSPEQMANMQKLLQQTGAQTQSQIKGVLQAEQARGGGNAGNTLASMLQAAQGGSQQGSENAISIGAQGANAQNQALKDYLAGIGNLRSADTARDTTNATLQQQADMWKAQNASSRQARNVGAQNQAQQYNLGRQNQVNDYNAQMTNQELLREQEAKRQAYLDKMNYIMATTNMATGNANQIANNNNQAWNSTTQGVVGIANAYGQNQNNQAMQDAYNRRTDTLAQQNYKTPNDGYSGFTPDPNAGQSQEEALNNYNPNWA